MYSVIAEKLLPVVKHDDVLAALSDYSQNILAEQSLLSPETFIKNRRDELKELEESLIGYNSQKDLLDHQQRERAANLRQLQDEIAQIMTEMAQLIGIQNNGFDRNAEESALTELRKQRTELLSNTSNNDTDKDIQTLMGKIRTVEKYIATLESKSYTSPYTARISETDAKLNSLRGEHDKINALTAERNKLNALNQQLQELNVARELDSEDLGEQLATVDNQIHERAHSVDT
jgi:hypothetical protein